MMKWSAASCVLFVVVTTSPVCAETGADAPSSAALLEQARRAVAAEDYEQAIERYDQLRELMPEAPEVPYNMGVAAYRGGDLDRAAEFFREALARAEDLPLRSKSAYNLGTTAYARNLQPAAPGAAGAEEPDAQLDGAIEELRRALGHYRQAIDTDPSNTDAKANAELTYRRLKRLEELHEQMQQMPQDQQQDRQDEQGQRQEENRSSSQPGQQEPQDQQEQQQQEQLQNGQTAESQEEETDEAAQRRTMTREEAERLLQRVRDKARRRREERADRQERRRPPVDRDW